MVTLALDSGSPLPAFPEGSRSGMALVTSVCPGPTCPLLHLRAVPAAEGERFAPDDPHDAHDADGERRPDLLFALDTRTRRLEPAKEDARAYLASDEGGWLPSWVEGHLEVLLDRFARLEGQRAGEQADARPAPPWKPGVQILHQQLYPFDFTPWIELGDDLWLIADATCPDPGCPCRASSLSFFGGPGGARIEVSGELGDREPRRVAHGAEDVGRALWAAVHDDEDLLESLRDRHDDVRSAGPFIVGSAYEQARLSAREGRPVPEAAGPVPEEGGYLAGGAVPLSLVERLFAVGARVHARRFGLGMGFRSWFRVEVSGAVAYDGFGQVVDEPFYIELCQDVAADEPDLYFALEAPGEVTLAHRRQRIALGLPLLGGLHVPLVERVLPGAKLGDSSADDVRLATALGEALLAVPIDEIAEQDATPRVFEHRVEGDTGLIHVRLTTSPAEAPWEEHDDEHEHEHEHEGHSHHHHHDHDEDDLLDEDGVHVVVEAFTDAALDRGLPRDVVEAGCWFVTWLAERADEEGSGEPWHEEANVEGLLQHPTPDVVRAFATGPEHAPAALHAVAEWLGEVGHADAGKLHVVIDRHVPALLERARRPRPSPPASRAMAKANPPVVTRSPDRWQPAPGEPAPAPTAPCPCGSGRRYKKCCMSR